MQKYFNTVTNRSGTAQSSAFVTVKTLAGTTPTLYSDNGSTPMASNVIPTDDNGYFEFYAADGRYTLTITGSNFNTITISDILLEDAADGSTPLTEEINARIAADAAAAAALAASTGAALVGFAPSGTIAAVTVQAALDELGSEKAAASDLSASTGAAMVGNAPAGDIAATTVQAAIDELDSKKASLAALAASGGSALVGYLPAGTGAVETTVRSKLRESVSAADYGENTTPGTTDMASAIQAAINELSARDGGDVILDGDNAVGTTIILKPRVRLVGRAKTGTILRPTAAFKAAMEDAGGTGYNLVSTYQYDAVVATAFASCYDVGISNISFIFDTPTSLGVLTHKNNCVGLNNSKRVVIEDCIFYGWGQHSVDISGCQDVTIQRTNTYGSYWAAIQVDQGSGLYGSVGGASQKSDHIYIINNRVEGSQSTYGAIQIHKNGGDDVYIKNNVVINCLAGICTDDWYAEAFAIGQSTRLFIEENHVSSTVASSVGIRVAKDGTHTKIAGNKVAVLGEALVLRGARTSGAKVWHTDIYVRDNTLSGSTSRLTGCRHAHVKDNKFISSSAPVRVAMEHSHLKDNIFQGYGVWLQAVTETDGRDASSNVYENAFLDLDGNSMYSAAGGVTVSYKVVCTGFAQIRIRAKDYFAYATAFDYTAGGNTGLIVEDQFRGMLRGTVVTSNLMDGMFWYNPTKDRIEVYNGSATLDAIGTLAASAAYDPPSLAVGTCGAEQTKTVTGAALGDHVTAAFSLDSMGLEIVARVSAADTVKWYFHNPAGNPNGTQDLGSGIVSFRVITP